MKVLQNKNSKRIAKIWVKDLAQVESSALDQITSMLEMPSLFQHIAVMPDTHFGMGAVIGGVVATKGIVVPNIVGVDIGCGMSAFPTKINFSKEIHNKEFWLDWKQRLNRKVPVGFNSHRDPQDLGDLQIDLKAKELQQLMKGKASLQLGTLGGGNHFLEAQVDQDGKIWLMVHSGSRHTGLRIASYYNNLAKKLNEKYHTKTPSNLNFLPTDDQSGQDYLHDMKWAVDFALENRWKMLEAMFDSFDKTHEALDMVITTDKVYDVRKRGINIHHNFANMENHFGDNVMVHRKGATQAYKGQLGIIPGSMGATSYIIEGVGNDDSFKSCSHGAGRRMSRTQAKKDFKSSDLQKALEGTFTKPSIKHMDEAPMAYKDINEVMENQKDLVNIKYTLKPIITVKG